MSAQPQPRRTNKCPHSHSFALCLFLPLTSATHNSLWRNRSIGKACVMYTCIHVLCSVRCVGCLCMCEGISGWQHYLLHVALIVALYRRWSCLHIHTSNALTTTSQNNQFLRRASFKRAQLMIIEKENSSEFPFNFINYEAIRALFRLSDMKIRFANAFIMSANEHKM